MLDIGFADQPQKTRCIPESEGLLALYRQDLSDVLPIYLSGIQQQLPYELVRCRNVAGSSAHELVLFRCYKCFRDGHI
jgi:hypothetical protein